MKARRPELAELVDAYEDQRILVEIGRDLIVEKDPERLLGLILDACRRITGADAGSIFLCEEDEEGAAVLRFAYSHTFSRDLPYTSFTMPRDERSIAGYVSLTGDVLNIPDVYEIESGRSFSFNRGYDLSSGYRTKSMLALPMRDHLGRVIGVIQLINSKETREAELLEVDSGRCAADEVRLDRPADFETKVCPFKPRYVPLMEAVANQAAIALENTRMIARIARQFEAFVRASVAAIESRDPGTRGHSERVAAMAKALMRATHAEREDLYAACCFGREELLEIEYAGLLHDYGKVYLEERASRRPASSTPRRPASSASGCGSSRGAWRPRACAPPSRPNARASRGGPPSWSPPPGGRPSASSAPWGSSRSSTAPRSSARIPPPSSGPSSSGPPPRRPSSTRRASPSPSSPSARSRASASGGAA